MRGDDVLDTDAVTVDDVYATGGSSPCAVRAPVEPRVHAELLQRLGLADEALPAQHDVAGQARAAAWLAHDVLRHQMRDESTGWSSQGIMPDACVSPVLTFAEAKNHPHNIKRLAHVAVGAVDQPAPAPRFSRTPGAIRNAPPERGAHGAQALADWGFDGDAIERLRSAGRPLRGAGFAMLDPLDFFRTVA